MLNLSCVLSLLLTYRAYEFIPMTEWDLCAVPVPAMPTPIRTPFQTPSATPEETPDPTPVETPGQPYWEVDIDEVFLHPQEVSNETHLGIITCMDIDPRHSVSPGIPYNVSYIPGRISGLTSTGFTHIIEGLSARLGTSCTLRVTDPTIGLWHRFNVSDHNKCMDLFSVWGNIHMLHMKCTREDTIGIWARIRNSNMRSVLYQNNRLTHHHTPRTGSAELLIWSTVYVNGVSMMHEGTWINTTVQGNMTDGYITFPGDV